MESKILIAEDETKIRQLISSYLVREGFKVIEAADGEQAVERFDENEDVVLVMLDVMMPRKDGYDVCREIRGKSDVPILMLTARQRERYERCFGVRRAHHLSRAGGARGRAAHCHDAEGIRPALLSHQKCQPCAHARPDNLHRVGHGL